MNFRVNIYQDNKEFSGWYFSIQNKTSIAGKYSQGLYDLIFRGNEELNQQIPLGNTGFHSRNHQLINFGKYYKKFSLGLVIGNILQEYNGSFEENDFINFSDNYKWNLVQKNRSGGFNQDITVRFGESYEPEITDSYELGIKNSYWNDRFILNLSTYYIDFSNQQQYALIIGGDGNIRIGNFNFDPIELFLLHHLKLNSTWFIQ